MAVNFESIGPVKLHAGDSGSASRFSYSAKASASENRSAASARQSDLFRGAAT